ncbi:MAG: DUF3556 domain-containing protein [Nitriliruptorales bacterium]|nr:DUF3556 domain-containing protein [Nitriliruptorales bacterium]
MHLNQPTLPDVDPDAFEAMSERERVGLLSVDWTTNGFGAPVTAYAFYVIKIAGYVALWVFFVSRASGIAGWSDIGDWWATPLAFQKAIVWTLVFEVLGFGCGSGPLTGRYIPPIVAFTHFARPGTIRLPAFPDRVPLTAGDRRHAFDVALYLAIVILAFRALLSPDTLSLDELLPLIVLLPLIGLRDKTVFLAARSEHYWPLLIVFAFALDGSRIDVAVLWGGAMVVQWAIWWGAAASKLNHHFPSVVAIMVSNSPWLRSERLLKRMYRDHPVDLRPSTIPTWLAHGGTAIEFVFPLILVTTDGGLLTTIALVVMFSFHLFITSNFPMGVPLEWNVVFVYSMFVLFGAHPEFSPFDAFNEPLLGLLLVAGILVGPVYGSIRPDKISFLPSMRYYAGNWAASLWLIRPEFEETFDEKVIKTAPNLRAQIVRLYDDHTANLLQARVRAFRSMHLHGRALNALLNDVVDDVDDWLTFDGEGSAGIALGWNFGDGHLHHEQLLAALQARCGFEPDQLRIVYLESQPFHRPWCEWRYVDAAAGELDRGRVHVADLLDHQPWPEPGAINLRR